LGPDRNAALFRGQRAPASGDAADVVPVKLLVGGAGIAKAPVLARDIAVTGLEIDDRALPARLGNGTDFHVVSGIRLLSCWFPRPHSGECSNRSPTGASDASGIKCLHVQRSRTLPQADPAHARRTPAAPNPAIALQFHVGRHWRGIGEHYLQLIGKPANLCFMG